MPDDNDHMHTGYGLRPIPDPTLLTTQQLQIAISALKELIFTRLDSMDKALDLYQDNINRVPSETDREIRHLKEFIEERFASIATRFVERDMRGQQTKEDAKIAIDTALSSAEKLVNMQQQSSAQAIAKSEFATSESIKQLQILINTAIATLDGKINDVKERLTAIDGRTAGQALAGAAHQTSYTNTHGVVGMAIGAIMGLAGLTMTVIAMNREPPPAAVIVERPAAALPTTTTTTQTPR